MYRWNLYQSTPCQRRCKKRAPGHDDHQCIGISRGGRSTKIHAVVDGLGYPLVLELTGGQVHDGVMLQKCLDQLQISGSTFLRIKPMDPCITGNISINMTQSIAFPRNPILSNRGTATMNTIKNDILLKPFS